MSELLLYIMPWSSLGPIHSSNEQLHFFILLIMRACVVLLDQQNNH